MARLWHGGCDNERPDPVFCVFCKLAHLIYGVVKSGKPFDANFSASGLAIQDGI
jgi:hypothetical protein